MGIACRKAQVGSGQPCPLRSLPSASLLQRSTEEDHGCRQLGTEYRQRCVRLDRPCPATALPCRYPRGAAGLGLRCQMEPYWR